MDKRTSLKKNVTVFNQDVLENEGYRYTTNASFSSIVANKRITDAVLSFITKNVKSLIDIGCGDGVYSIDLFNARPNIKMSAYDPAAEAVAIAKRKRPEIDFYVANLLEKESIRDEQFDLAVIRGVLHHLKDPELAIKNAGKSSNRILIIEPNGNNPVLKMIEKKSPYHIEHEERSFSSVQLCKWCKEQGYTIKKVTFIGFVPFFFPTLPAKVIYFFQPLLEKIPLLGRFLGAQVIILAEKA